MRHLYRLALPLVWLPLAGCGADGPMDLDSFPEIDAAATTARRGEITIRLDMRPKTPDDVSFSTQGMPLKTFALDDDQDPRLPASRTFANLKPGTYTVTQTTEPDGPLTQVRCGSNGVDDNLVDIVGRTVTIGLEAGESVSCTFVDGWEDADGTTFGQFGWAGGIGGAILTLNYTPVYASTFQLLEVGIPNPAPGFALIFTSAADVLDYLPEFGPAGPLTSDLLRPTTSVAGVFGANVTALVLNRDLSDAGVTWTSAGLPTMYVGPVAVPFGDLVLCGVPQLPTLEGLRVRDFIDIVSTLLGGGAHALTIAQLDPVAFDLGGAFGGDRAFAQDHLFIGACP